MKVPISLIVLFCLALIGSTFSPACRADDRSGYFPILPWELPPRAPRLDEPGHGLPSIAECGFTTAAFVLPRQVEECHKLGLRALVRLDPAMKEWDKLSDQQILDRVSKLVAGTQNNPAVLGYFLTDEPSVANFPALAKAVADVKKLAPGKLAYINLFPGYAKPGAANLSMLGTRTYAEYLDRYVTEVKPQFISYDDYEVQYSRDLKNPMTTAEYFWNLLEVRQVALAHDLPFWTAVSSNEIRPFTPPPSPANMLLQAYASLAAGAHGLTWFTYYSAGYHRAPYHYAPVDRDGHRTVTWSYLQMVNNQIKTLGPILNTLKSTGVYFTPPAPAADLPVLPGKLVEQITSSSPAMLGEFAGPNNEKYILLVNLSLEQSAKFDLKLCDDADHLFVVSPVDAGLSPIEKSSLWLTAGQGALLKIDR